MLETLKDILAFGGEKICLEELLGKRYLGTTSKLFFLPLTFQTVPCLLRNSCSRAVSALKDAPTIVWQSWRAHKFESDHHPICVFVFLIDEGTECQKFVSFRVTESGKQRGALFKCRQAFIRLQ